MFIKRINKIYAPPKFAKPKHPLPRSSSQKNQKIPETVLKVHLICSDPHARFICLYCEVYDTIYVISVLTLLNYIQAFREEFSRSKQYSLKTCLKPDLIIQNPKPSLHILQIKFSHCVQGTQFLVVAYYSGEIDMYSVVTGKKIDGLDIAEGNKNMREGISPIYNVNVIGHSIFISTYDGKLLCYQGRELGPCLKFDGQWIRLCYDYQEDNQETRERIKPYKRQDAKKLKKAPLFQDKNNILMLGHCRIQKKKQKQKQKKQISKSKQKQKQKQPQPSLTQSYQQYLRFQSKKLPPTSEYNKYTLSQCQRFLICRNEQQLIINNCYICSSFYTIRAREFGWGQFEDSSFYKMPVINQFWGIGVGSDSSSKSNKYNNLLEYSLNSKQILIATIGYYSYTDNKLTNQHNITNQHSLTILKATTTTTTNNNRKLNFKLVCRLEQAKQEIIDIRWIGPNILIYLGCTGNLYYMEIHGSLLID